MGEASRLDPQQGVYGISVAAELVGMGVQNLRPTRPVGCSSPNAPMAEPAATALTISNGCAVSVTCWTPD